MGARCAEGFPSASEIATTRLFSLLISSLPQASRFSKISDAYEKSYRPGATPVINSVSTNRELQKTAAEAVRVRHAGLFKGAWAVGTLVASNSLGKV